MTLSLNPDYYLKWDIKRFVLYTKGQCVHNGHNNWISFIHPLHLFIIGTLSLEHDINNTIAAIQKRLPINSLFIEKFISNLIENQEVCHIKSTNGDASFPENLILKRNIPHPQKSISDLIQKSLIMNEVDLKTIRLYHSPLKITWMINNKCAVHCIYCYADTSHKCHELPFDKFKGTIETCQKEDMQICEIIGGDFFFKKDWEKYLKCLIENGFTPPFLSTKKILTDNELQSLTDIGYSGVFQFSLDTLSQQEIKSIINCPSQYIERVKNMFFHLSQKGTLPFKVRISTVLIQSNASIKTIQNIYAFFSTLHLLDEWEIRFAMPSFNQVKDFLCTKEQINEITEYIHSLRQISCIPISFIEYSKTNIQTQCLLADTDKYNYRCSANMRHCFILPDGQVTICERLYWNPNFIIGDLNTMTLSEIWNSPKAKKLAFDMERHISNQSPCFECDRKEICFTRQMRCWVNVVNKWGANRITYPDPICIKSK